MNTWTTFKMDNGDHRIRLDLLEADGKTAGWVVRRSVDVFHAFISMQVPVDAVIDLENDGIFLGVFCDLEDARQAVLDSLGIVEPCYMIPAIEPLRLSA